MPTIKKRMPAAKDRNEQEIVTIAHKVTDALAGYKKQVIMAGSVLAAILVVAALISLYQSGQERSAAPKVAAALEAYVPASAMGPDFPRALGMFREIQKKYSGTKSGAIAQYYIGNCLVNMGQVDEGLKEYWAFTNKYTGEKLLLGMVYQRMAYAYASQGKLADATKAFEQAEAVTGPGVATIELARLLEASGNMPEAQKRYKLVAERLGGTTWAMEAMGKVQLIAPPVQPTAAGAGK